MPLYEYRCASCNHRFEVLQRLGADAQGLVCPECGHGEVAKQFSTFASAVSGGSKTACAPACGPGFG